MTTLTDIHKNASWLSGTEESNVIIIPNFLPEEQRNGLFDTLIQAQDAFYYRIAAGRRITENICFSPDDEDYLPRDYQVVTSEAEREGSGLKIKEACKIYENRIVSNIPEINKALNISTSPLTKLPLTIINGRNSHISLPHKDETNDRFKISLLYYLHKYPKPFEGGDLEFYGTSQSQPASHDPNPAHRITHQDNMLVVFPSSTFHGTTPVKSTSNRFEDGRFVFVSFL